MRIPELVNRFYEICDMDLTEEEFNEQLKVIAGEMDDIADSIATAKAKLLGDAEIIKQEEKRLYERRKALENKADRLHRYLYETMLTLGRTKFRTEFYSFGIQNTKASVVIDDTEKIPEEFWTHPAPEINKKALYEFLNTGEASEFAHLEKGNTLVIR